MTTEPPAAIHGQPSIRLRSLSLNVFLPTVLFGIGQGAFLPVLIPAAAQLGGTLDVAVALVALVGIGQLVADVPAGGISGRVGERRTMIVAAVLAVFAATTCLLAGSVPVLAVGALGMGAVAALFGVSRQAYVTAAFPYERRGRALSTLAGSTRVGLFIGPLLGASAMGFAGIGGAQAVTLGAVAIVGLVLVFTPDPPGAKEIDTGSSASTGRIVAENWRVLRSLGVAVILLGAVRASRQAIIPLWSAHLGLDPQVASLLFALSAGIDMALFYPAGIAMDRAGRRRTAVPSLLILTLAHVAVPFADSAATLALVAIALGVGNGFSSGIMMTLGADASPVVGRSQFLGAWRLCQDLGGAVGPVISSAVIGAASVGAVPLMVAAIGVLATAGMYRWIPHRALPVRVSAPGSTGPG